MSTDRSSLDALFQAARAARDHAYTPYSRFKVGAAVRDEAGTIHAGANVENAAYPVGACAEQSAISAMVTQGGRRIVEAVVLGWPEGADGRTGPLCTPCGACRQRLREFMALDAPVYLANAEGIRETVTLADLLPRSFGPDHLAGTT